MTAGGRGETTEFTVQKRGAVGVILDAHGRSLGAGPIPQNRPVKVKQWLDAVNGVTLSNVRRADAK